MDSQTHTLLLSLWASTHIRASCSSSRRQAAEWKQQRQHRCKSAATARRSVHLHDKMWFHKDASHRKLEPSHLSFHMHLTQEVCDHGKEGGRMCLHKLSNKNPLTYLSNQFHLKTVSSTLTAITPQVRVFKLIDADGVIPLWALVWKGFHPAMSGVHELNTAFKCEVDQVRLRTVDPRRPVRTTCWKAAWEEHRGARWSAECVRLTQIRVLARILQVLLILTLRERNKFQD